MIEALLDDAHPELAFFVKNDAAIRIGEARGKAEGKAEAILAVLSARGLAMSEAQRERVQGCTDIATLDRWIAHAATAGSTDKALA